MLSERRVAFQELVEHASEGEPVGRRVVGSALGQHLGCHVPVGADGGVRLLLTEVAGQTEVRNSHVAVLIWKEKKTKRALDTICESMAFAREQLTLHNTNDPVTSSSQYLLCTRNLGEQAFNTSCIP